MKVVKVVEIVEVEEFVKAASDSLDAHGQEEIPC